MNANTHLNFHYEEDCIAEFENTFRKSMKTCFPYKLKELLKDRRIIFGSTEGITDPVSKGGRFGHASTVTPMILHPSKKISFISAIDSSVIHLARTEEGRLYAAKSGVVTSSDRRIRHHFRLGPMLIYLTEELLCNSNIDHYLAKLLLVDSSIAKRFIRTRLERAVQLVLSSRLNDSIILIDGTLRPSIFEDYNCTINRVIEISTLNNNDVIGLSKNTSITFLNQFENILKATPYSACLDIECVIKSLTKNTLGNNMLVKLGENKYEYALRADVCSANGNELECLEKLIGNDTIFRSYPESLKLAHHISTFTTTEVSTLKGLISGTCGADADNQITTRKSLLGVSFV
jgi:NurA domain